MDCRGIRSSPLSLAIIAVIGGIAATVFTFPPQLRQMFQF